MRYHIYIQHLLFQRGANLEAHRCRFSVEQGTMTTPKAQLQCVLKGTFPRDFRQGWALFTQEENIFNKNMFVFVLLVKKTKYFITAPFSFDS